MATRIVHFGADECARLIVLSHSGYDVDVCGTSILKLQAILQNVPIDAIAVSEDGRPVEDDVVAVSRELSPAPLVLFEGVDHSYDPAPFDLVIPRGSHPVDWLEQLRQTIEQSRVMLEDAKLLREHAAALRRESLALRSHSASTRERARRLRAKPQDLDNNAAD